MATNNPVTNLLTGSDFNVILTVFDNLNNASEKSANGIYEAWLRVIKSSLGNCVFRNPFGIIRLSTSERASEHICVASTEEVMCIIRNAFDIPETFRIDIINTNDTVHSWIIALIEDII